MARRGEVWWYEPPDRDPRPHVIVLRDPLPELLPFVTAVPTTTVVRGLPTEVELEEQDGMPRPCVAVADQVTQVERIHLRARITTLGPERMSALCAALTISLDC